jgi:hypothetical protein
VQVMPTKQSSKASKGSKNRSKRIPTVKRLESVLTLGKGQCKTQSA